MTSDPNQELEAMLAASGSPFGAMGGGGSSAASFSGVLQPGQAPPGQGGAMPFGAASYPLSDNQLKGLGRDPMMANPIDPMQEPRVQTTPMDFTRLTQNMPSRSVPVSKDLCQHLMTPDHRAILTEESGADVEWAPEEAQVHLRGSAEQLKKAQRLLARVTTHCHWGRGEQKVRRLLQPPIIDSVVVRLSPMNPLRPAEKALNQGQTLSIGKDKNNDTVIPDSIVSRQHCVLELDSERGAVYILDCSTNGTFLNGRRLPGKKAGKVLLSHGDELLLKDPGSEPDFGYIVNLTELRRKE